LDCIKNAIKIQYELHSLIFDTVEILEYFFIMRKLTDLAGIK
jgi:hypothetical protein